MNKLSGFIRTENFNIMNFNLEDFRKKKKRKRKKCTENKNNNKNNFFTKLTL